MLVVLRLYRRVRHMVRSAIICALALVAVGCSSNQVVREVAPAVPFSPAPALATAPAIALAFESASALGGPELDRERREPGAYLGYESQTTTFSYTRYDDRVRFEQGSGHFERRAMGERFGVISR